MNNGNNGRTTWLPTLESAASQAATSDKVTGKRLLAMAERQGFCCALSGVKLTPRAASLDHIVPVSKGGGHGMDNVQIVHEDINRMKGTMTNEAFIEWCRRVASHNET